jgi:type III secretion HrpO family protein
MDLSTIVEYCQRGLMMSLWVSLPTAVAAGVVGLVFAALQAVTQLQDQTVATIVKLIVASIVLAIAAPWIVASVLRFTDEMWSAGGFLPVSAER